MNKQAKAILALVGFLILFSLLKGCQETRYPYEERKPLPVGERNPYDPTDTRTWQERYDQREKFECTDCSDDTKKLLDLL